MDVSRDYGRSGRSLVDAARVVMRNHTFEFRGRYTQSWLFLKHSMCLLVGSGFDLKLAVCWHGCRFGDGRGVG